MGPLLPKLRGYIAEFLNQGYLEHLSIFYSPTCVSLRYGHPLSHLGVFLGGMGLATSPLGSRREVPITLQS